MRFLMPSFFQATQPWEASRRWDPSPKVDVNGLRLQRRPASAAGAGGAHEWVRACECALLCTATCTASCRIEVPCSASSASGAVRTYEMVSSFDRPLPPPVPSLRHLQEWNLRGPPTQKSIGPLTQRQLAAAVAAAAAAGAGGGFAAPRPGQHQRGAPAGNTSSRRTVTAPAVGSFYAGAAGEAYERAMMVGGGGARSAGPGSPVRGATGASLQEEAAAA